MRILYKDIWVDYEFVDNGCESTTVFLHGWGGNKDILKWIDADSNSNKLYIDLPPFGDSDEPIQPWVLDDYVGIVYAIYNLYDLNKINIVAHSFGGRMAMRIASSTDIVDKMVLIDVAGLERKSLLTRCKILHYKWKKLLVKIGLLDGWFVVKSGSEDYSALSPIMKETFKNIIKVNQRKEVKKIKAETLVVWGDQDEATPLSSGRYLARRLKVTLVVYRGGHYAFVYNKEDVIDKVNKFFRS